MEAEVAGFLAAGERSQFAAYEAAVAAADVELDRARRKVARAQVELGEVRVAAGEGDELLLAMWRAYVVCLDGGDHREFDRLVLELKARDNRPLLTIVPADCACARGEKCNCREHEEIRAAAFEASEAAL